MSTNPFDSPTHSSSFAASDLSSTHVLFGFEGRIPRSVYWLYTILMTVIYIMAVVGLTVIFGEESAMTNLGILVLYIPLIWVSLALQVKRWHDRGYSGWMVLIGFIPIIGGIWSFVELGCLRGTEGPNAYGADPT